MVQIIYIKMKLIFREQENKLFYMKYKIRRIIDGYIIIEFTKKKMLLSYKFINKIKYYKNKIYYD